MSLNHADGAALVAAAVQAAIREHAPRRTVAAVAAAVASVVFATRSSPSATRAKATCDRNVSSFLKGDTQSAAADNDDPVQLLNSLRAVRSAQRKRKKERKQAAKQAAYNAQRAPTDSEPSAHIANSGSDIAGQSTDHGGGPGAVLANQPSSTPPVSMPPTLRMEPLPEKQADSHSEDSYPYAPTLCASQTSLQALSNPDASAGRRGPYGRASAADQHPSAIGGKSLARDGKGKKTRM